MEATNCYRDSVSIKLGIADLPSGTGSLDLVVPPGEANIQLGEGELAGPLKISLKAWKDRDGLVLEGRVTCPVKFACVRCLDEFTADITFPIEANYLFREEPSPVDPWEEGYLPREITSDTVEIDLGPDVYDGLILTVPMKPLCQADCRGLCPVCYSNRNLVDCDCRKEEADGRWSKLRQLRQEIEPR